MKLKDIQRAIQLYLYKYGNHLDENMKEDVGQDALVKILENEGMDLITENKIWGYVSNAVKKWSKDFPPYVDVYELDPADTEAVNFLTLEFQRLTLSTVQQSKLLLFVTGLAPDTLLFSDLGLTEEQFKRYPEEDLTIHNYLNPAAYITSNPAPPYATNEMEIKPEKIKKFSKGHIAYVNKMYTLKDGAAETIIELHNQGKTWQEISRHFVQPPSWNGRITQTPKASALDIKAVLDLCHRISAEQAEAWLEYTEHKQAQTPTDSRTAPPATLDKLNDLEHLEALLNNILGVSCHIVHDATPRLVIHQKCKTCNRPNSVSIYESDEGFTFSCGKCAAKNNHHGIYRRAGGNSLGGALRHMNIKTREDYTA